MVAAPLAHIFHTTVVAGVPGYRRKVDVREGLAVHEIYIPLTTSPAEICCSKSREKLGDHFGVLFATVVLGFRA